MADEIKKIISIDVTQAVSSLEDIKSSSNESSQSFQTLGEAKKYIDKLKASLIDLDENSKEYKDRCEEIAAVQQKVSTAMKAGSNTGKAAEGSYNALAKQMAELKKQFKATNDEAERESLAKQIVGINDQLKEMDSSIGNYQRNVGNYEAAFTTGLTKITDQIKALNNPLETAKQGVSNLNTAFKAIIKNPIGAVIAALVAVIGALKKGFDQSEEASNKLKKGLAALEPITNAISNIFTKLANVVGSIAEKAIPALVKGVSTAGLKIAELLNKIGIVSDEKLNSFRKTIDAQKEMVDQTVELTEREIKLQEKRRTLTKEQARLEAEISDLLDKVNDKEKYTYEERQKLIESAIKKQKYLSSVKESVAKEELEVMKERASLTDNDKEANDKLAESEAKVYSIRKEGSDRLKELNEKQRAIKEEGVKTTEEANKKVIKSDEEVNKQREKDLKTIEEINQRISDSHLTSSERDINTLTKKYEEEKALLEKYNEDTAKLTAEYEANIAKIKSSEKEGNLNNKLDDIDAEADLQSYIAERTIESEYKKNQRLMEIDRERLTQRKATLEELLNMDSLEEEKKQEYADELARVNADIVQNSKDSKQAEKDHAAEIIDTYAGLASSLGSLMGDIASIWQDNIKQRYENGEITREQAEEEFENSKKMQIATAIVNGLAGVATAVSTAMQLGPIAGPIVGAINSALVMTTTMAQVSKIKQTKFDSGSSSVNNSSTSTPTNAATAYVPTYSTNVTGQSETTDLANAVKEGQTDMRVYVVESDIAQSAKRVEVREEESTF